MAKIPCDKSAAWFAVTASLLVCMNTFGFSMGGHRLKKKHQEKEISEDLPGWPVWRGTNGDGINPDKEWNPEALKDGPKILWNKNVGAGYSAVTVSGDYVYTMGNVNNKDVVYCLKIENGDEVWRYEYSCKAGSYPGTRATPVIDDKGHVYTFSREGHVFCLDAKNGRVIWKKNVQRDAGARNIGWGFSSSPLLKEKLVILNAATYGVAYRMSTGAVAWKSPGGKCGYATPVYYEQKGKKCVAVFGQKTIFGVDIKSGRKLWSFPWETKYDVNAADPVFHDGKLFIASGYGKGCTLLDISGREPKQLWVNKTIRPHFSSSVLIDGYIYGADGNTGRGSLKCVKFDTGDEVWSQRTGFISLMAAGDYLVFITERGELVIAKIDPKKYTEVSRAKVINARRKVKCWTAPVYCLGKIFCRASDGKLVCVDVSKKK